MSKEIYKGYELIKAIADGEIKEDTKFREMEENRYYMVKDRKLWEQEDTGIYNSKLESLQITYGVFELIEEDTIDIESIEEIQTEAIGNLANEMKDKFNKILQWAKQHDKEIKELKEK